MAIRDGKDSLSRVESQKRKYFEKQDPNATNLNFNRFVFMKPGNKDVFFDWRIDFEKESVEYNKFVISEERFINRPDAISYDVYGNAKYWWLIAMANNIKEPFFDFYKGRELKIPDLVSVKKIMGL